MKLADITVDEVSLVDKAANKRTFAFVKRDQAAEEAEAKAKAEAEAKAAQEAKLKAEAEEKARLAAEEPTAEDMAEAQNLLTELTSIRTALAAN